MPPREGSDVGCSRIPADRADSMFFYDAALAAGSGEIVHLRLVDFDLALFFQPRAQVVEEQSLDLLLLFPHQLIAQLIPLLGKLRISRRRFLPLQHLEGTL